MNRVKLSRIWAKLTKVPEVIKYFYRAIKLDCIEISVKCLKYVCDVILKRPLSKEERFAVANYTMTILKYTHFFYKQGKKFVSASVMLNFKQ